MQSTGATYVPYIGLSDGLAHIRRLVETPGDERMLIGAYYGQLDAICHVYGTGTPQHAAEVAQIDAAAAARDLRRDRSRRYSLHACTPITVTSIATTSIRSIWSRTRR